MIVKLRRRFVVSSREYVSILKYFLHSIKASLNIYATSINVSSGVVLADVADTMLVCTNLKDKYFLFTYSRFFSVLEDNRIMPFKNNFNSLNNLK